MEKKQKKSASIFQVIAKKIIWLFVVFIAVPVLAFSGFMVYLQTPSGHTWLENQIKNNLGDAAGVHAKVEGLSGALPLQIKAESLKVFDKETELLEAREVNLRWSPWRLLSGQVRVDSLHSNSLNLKDIPSGGQGGGQSSSIGLVLKVDNLKIGQFEISEKVAGMPIAGEIDGSFRLGFTGITSNIKAKIKAEKISSESITLETKTSGSFKDIAYEIKASSGDETLKVDGVFNTKKNLLQAKFEGESKSISKFLEGAQGSLKVSGAMTYDIGKTSLSSDCKVSLLDFKSSQDWARIIAGNTTAAAYINYDGKAFEIKSIKVATSTFSAQGAGTYKNGRIGLQDLMVTLDDASLLSKAIQGALSVTANGYYDVAKSDFDIELKSPGVTVQSLLATHLNVKLTSTESNNLQKGILGATLTVKGALNNSLFEAQAKARKSGDMVTLDDAVVQFLSNTVSGHSKINLKNQTVDGDIKVDIENLAPIARMVIGTNMPGRLQGAINLRSRNKFQDLKADLELTGTETYDYKITEAKVKADLQDVFGQLHGAADLSALTLRYEKMKTDKLDAKYRFKDGKCELSLKTEGGNTISNISFKGVKTQKLQRYFLDQFNVTYKSIPISIATQKSGDPVIELAQNKTTLFPMNVTAAGNTLSVNGIFTPSSIKASAKIDDFSIETLSALGIYHGPDGKMNLKVDIKGRPASPQIESTIDMFYLYNPRQNVSINKSAKVNGKVSYRNNFVTLDFIGVPEGDGTFSVKGKIPAAVSFKPVSFRFLEGRAVDVVIKSNVDLEPFNSLFASSESVVDGMLVGEMRIGGSVDSLSLRGALKLNDGYYENVLLQSVVKNLNGRIISKGRKLYLEGFKGEDGEDGKVSLQGFADFGKPSPEVDVKAIFQNFFFSRSESLSGVADGSITLTGPMKRPKLSGDLSSPKLEVDIFEELGISVPKLNLWDVSSGHVRSFIQQSPKKSSVIDLDVKVTVPKKLYIRGRGLESEWKSNLKITGPSSRAIVEGKIELIRGNFSFSDKTLTLTKGNITFTGTSDNDPTLDVEAIYETNDLKITLTVTGTGKNPKVSLTSNPPLPIDEILSQFLFGESASNISPFQAIMLARAAYSVKKGGTLDLFVDKVRDVLGLDVITFKESESGSDADELSFTLSVGKYITDKIYISVDQGVGVDDTKIMANLEVTKNFSIESEVGSSSGAGFGIKYKYDY